MATAGLASARVSVCLIIPELE